MKIFCLSKVKVQLKELEVTKDIVHVYNNSYVPLCRGAITCDDEFFSVRNRKGDISPFSKIIHT